MKNRKKFGQQQKSYHDKKSITKIEIDGSNVEIDLAGVTTSAVYLYKYLFGCLAVVVAGFYGYRFAQVDHVIAQADNVISGQKNNDMALQIKTVVDVTLNALDRRIESGNGKEQKPKTNDRKKKHVAAGIGVSVVAGLIWMWRNRNPNHDPKSDKDPKLPDSLDIFERCLKWWLSIGLSNCERRVPVTVVTGLMMRWAGQIKDYRIIYSEIENMMNTSK